MIYEKLRIKDISRKLKNSEAIISAYIPANSKRKAERELFLTKV